MLGAGKTVAGNGPSTRARWALLVVAVGSIITLIVVTRRHTWTAVLLVAIGTVACGALAVAEHRRPRLGAAPIVAAILIVFAVAVARPPRSSSDVWSYAMYGRIVSVHHASPYDALPTDYRKDPIFRHVNHIWRRRGSVFGPAYVGFAAGGTAIAGDSAYANRLFFQITAALAGGAILWLIWRRTRSPSALVWLGLSPVFVLTVNDGHNDLFVGLAILAAAILVARNRGWAAGLVIGVVSLMKLTTLLGLVGIVLWAWRRNERRVAQQAAVAGVATVILGYLPFLGGAEHVLAGADKTVTPTSPWNPLAEILLGHNGGRDLTHPLAPNATLTAIFYAATFVVVCVALFVGWNAARERRPDAAMAATTASYAMAAEYTYPWYSLWSLPVLSADRRSPLAWVVWVQAALMLAVVRMPLHPKTTVLDTAMRGTLTYAAPLAGLAAFVIIGARAFARRADDDQVGDDQVGDDQVGEVAPARVELSPAT